jgi:hypothetical protein
MVGAAHHAFPADAKINAKRRLWYWVGRSLLIEKTILDLLKNLD